MFEPPRYDIIAGTDAAYQGFFPREDFSEAQPGAVDLMVPVGDDVEVGCRLHPRNPAWPTLLFFHGNGETVCDYDSLAQHYGRLGLNVCFAGYRGYAFSTGVPSYPAMITDAHQIFANFKIMLDTHDYTGPRYVMGRSMGSHSVVELAAHYPEDIAGLILESGVGYPTRALNYLREVGRTEDAETLERQHLEKVRTISIPTLFIYGDHDELVSQSSVTDFFSTLTMQEKRLEIIKGAGHNNLLELGWDQYMGALSSFAGASPVQT